MKVPGNSHGSTCKQRMKPLDARVTSPYETGNKSKEDLLDKTHSCHSVTFDHCFTFTMLTRASRVALVRATTRYVTVATTTRPLFDFRCFSAAPDDDNQKAKVPVAAKSVGKSDVPTTPEPLGKPIATSEKELPVSYADISRAHVVSRLHY